jgi:hypothetical protein
MSFILRLFLFTTDSITGKMAHLVESIPDEVRLDPLFCLTPGNSKIASGPSRVYNTVGIPVKIFPLNNELYFNSNFIYHKMIHK